MEELAGESPSQVAVDGWADDRFEVEMTQPLVADIAQFAPRGHAAERRLSDLTPQRDFRDIR